VNKYSDRCLMLGMCGKNNVPARDCGEVTKHTAFCTHVCCRLKQRMREWQCPSNTSDGWMDIWMVPSDCSACGSTRSMQWCLWDCVTGGYVPLFQPLNVLQP
jgi:hypothetical protein